MKSSSLAARVDVDREEAPDTPAEIRVGTESGRRARFDFRPFDARPFDSGALDRRAIVIRDQGLPLFRVR